MAAEASQFAMLDQLSTHRKLVNFHPRSISRRFQHNPTNPLVSFLDQVSLKTRSLQQKPCSKKISVFLRLISPHPLSTPMIHGLHSRRGEKSVNQMSVCADLRLEYLQNMISVWNICHVFADLSQTERSLSWPFKGSYLKHSLKRTEGHACPNIMRTIL